MKKRACALCKELVQDEGSLCPACDNERLEAAHRERIITGRGLNYGNSERYSQRNWIRAVKEYRKQEKQV